MKKFLIIVVVLSLMFSTVAAAETTIMYCTGNSVNERTEPNTKSKVVAQHNKGEQIKVKKSKDGWCQLTNGNWMSGQYLTKEKVKTQEKTTSNKNFTSQYLYIKDSAVNEREKPTTSSKILSTHTKGTRLKVVEESNGWFRIKNGGWIRSDLFCTYDDLISKYRNRYSDIIIVCIHEQKATFYKDGSEFASSSVVTGSNEDPTPKGLYTIFRKVKNATLMGDAHVDYFIEFNNGVGIHDASWRNHFGGSIYKEHGSHGCVNTPLDFAKTVYNNCKVNSTKVFVVE